MKARGRSLEAHYPREGGFGQADVEMSSEQWEMWKVGVLMVVTLAYYFEKEQDLACLQSR